MGLQRQSNFVARQTPAINFELPGRDCQEPTLSLHLAFLPLKSDAPDSTWRAFK
jgi:hypothetical protein